MNKINNFINFDLIKESLDRETIIKRLDDMIANDARNYMRLIPGLDKRIAGQLASIGIRPKYNDRNVFVIDSSKKMIYLFTPSDMNNQRKLIFKDIIMDGKQKQRNDALSIAKTFVTLEENKEALKKKLGREPTADEVWKERDRLGTRFMPAGVYLGTNVNQHTDYVTDDSGDKRNILRLQNWEKEFVSHALHGYYPGDERAAFMKRALNIVKNPNDDAQIDKYIKELETGKLKMNFSYGCINLTPRFLKYLKEYGEDAYIFNLTVDNQNYLVDNSVNFFNKQIQSDVCLSPQSLGGKIVDDIA
jgi:hypothetical protein